MRALSSRAVYAQRKVMILFERLDKLFKTYYQLGVMLNVGQAAIAMTTLVSFLLRLDGTCPDLRAINR